MTACAENGKVEKLTEVLQLVNHKKFDKDKFSGWLFTAHATGEITRLEYHDLFNKMEKNLHHSCTDRELQNVMKRMDWRTLGEFALTIYDNTKREKLLAETWVDMCQAQGLFESAVLQDNGMANNGRIMFALKSINHEPDFKITIIDSDFEIPTGLNKLEVKYCPSDKFLTYKEADLKSYISKNSYVLTVMGENKMLGANGNPNADDKFVVDDLNISTWIIMTPDMMRDMLNEIPVRSFQGYMGNKPSIRLYRDDQPKFSEYFTVRNWNKA